MIQFKDNFNGDDQNLLDSARALLELNESNSLTPHGIGGHAVNIINALAARLKIAGTTKLKVAEPLVNETPVDAFGTGAVRQKKLTDQYRFDLLDSNDEAMRRLAATYAEGFAKYGADNWKKGFPTSDLYAHAREHMLCWIIGDKSEDHLAHACWNLMTIMWMEKNKPEMMDFPSQQKG